jgi:hypothetical protein
MHEESGRSRFRNVMVALFIIVTSGLIIGILIENFL